MTPLLSRRCANSHISIPLNEIKRFINGHVVECRYRQSPSATSASNHGMVSKLIWGWNITAAIPAVVWESSSSFRLPATSILTAMADKTSARLLDVNLDKGWNVFVVQSGVTAAGYGDGWYMGSSGPGDLTFTRTPTPGFKNTPLEERL